ncbi:N-acetyltransferase family protein [Microbacterium gorillae]|uniref:GNAT family N-acetyltransferase n=1 Tax=Microbacterium gorillae TaxID=1231063 RepID=UPI003D96AC4A
MIGRLREATGADASAITAVHVASRSFSYGSALDPEDARRDRLPMWSRFLVDADRTTLVIESPSSSLLGFIHFREPADQSGPVQVVGLYVVPPAIGTGIGARLYEAFEARRNRRAAELEVWDGNERAKSFYRRRGWDPTLRIREGVAGQPFVTWVLQPATGQHGARAG